MRYLFFDRKWYGEKIVIERCAAKIFKLSVMRQPDSPNDGFAIALQSTKNVYLNKRCIINHPRSKVNFRELSTGCRVRLTIAERKKR